MGDYTLDEALVAVGFGNYQLILMAFGGIGYIGDAMEVMILSFIGSAVQSEWDLSPAQKSLISTVVFFGMLVGAYASGYISDTYGRKYVYIVFRLLLLYSLSSCVRYVRFICVIVR